MNSTPATKDIRILIVDDTPANIQALAAILKSNGYQISAATNGKQALEVLGCRTMAQHPSHLSHSEN
jgi:CheY-like chemotaxis protein